MKKLIVLVLFTLIAHCMMGQIDLGVKAGINISNFKTNEVLTTDYRINSSANGSLGYHAGAFLRASLFGVFIQPELIFTSISSEFVVEELATTTQELAKQSIGRVDMPVIIGAKLGNLRLGLGPVGSVIISDNSDLKDISGYEAKIKSATIGYQLGAGFDIWKIVFDFRYESNLSKLGDYIDTGTVNEKFDSRAKQIIFSLGFRF
jgi:hypothetical protein